MKVMHFISSKGIGRGEVYIDLVNTLCHNIDIVLLIPREALYKNRVNSKITIVEYKSHNSRNNPLLLIELLLKIKKIQPDIVHTHFAKASEIFKILNKLLNIPHIATKHNPRKAKIFNTISNVIAVSKGVRDSISNKNVHVIYNGVIPIKIAPSVKNKLFQILAVGRLDKIKGFDILIEACSVLNFPFLLQIVGEGKEREHLEELISKYKLQEKVKLLGFRKEIPQLIKNSDLVIMSSHSEGFSLVMVESLFYANLFVSTKVGGATEILDERFLFDIVDISSKIEDIYINYNMYKKHFEELKEKSSNKLLLTNIATEHIKIYQNILKEII